MMDTYLIKIDDKYLVDTNEEDFGKVPVGGWYDTGGNIGGVILSTERRKAKIIEGNINLKSYFFRIYNAMRYGTFKFNKLEIVRVKNERN